MSSTLEKLSSNQVKLTFDVAPDTFEKGMKAAYAKVVRNINIPGFRRGHAPRKVIEMHYGESILYEEAFDAIFPELYQEAIQEHALTVVDRPELDVQQIGKDGLKFTATVYVKPEVTLGQYKGVEAAKVAEAVTDDDVNAEIERARERVSRFEDVADRPVKLDDQVDIDYEGSVDGVPFEGGAAKGQKLVIGSGHFIPGFEEQLIGKEIGEEADISVSFPEDYHEKTLAGKPAVFHVKINGIQEKEMPAVDDEFAKDVSECDTLEAYKKELRENLEKQAESKAESAFENEVLEQVVENAQVDIPEAMVDDQINSMLRDMELRMMYQGLKMADYLKYTGQTLDEMKGMYKEEAENRVRTQLVLEAIRKAEGIEATEEETQAEIAKYAEQSKKSVEDFEKTLSAGDKEYFAELVATRKTVQMLKDEAKG